MQNNNPSTYFSTFSERIGNIMKNKAEIYYFLAAEVLFYIDFFIFYCVH